MGYLYMCMFIKSQNVLWFSVEQTLSHDNLLKGMGWFVESGKLYRRASGSQHLRGAERQRRGFWL